MTRKTLAALAVLGGAAILSTPAAAQSWQVRVGVGAPYHGADYRYGHQHNSVCSGARAYQLENRVRHEVREGDIDRYQARRIHREIDRTERVQRRACSRWGDRYALRNIAVRYDRIERWIENAEHRGRRYGYRGNYPHRGW